MSRPPNIPRETRIRNARKFIANEILETGAPPSVRKLNFALGYSEGGSARTYEAARKLCTDPRLIYVSTGWQNFVYPIEVWNAMQKAAKEVLKVEAEDEKE